MKKTSEYGHDQIGTELDTFIRNHVMYETPTKEWLKSVKTEIGKIVQAHFPKRKHQTFFRVYTVGNDFYCIIGFRPLDAKKFSFINCSAKAGCKPSVE